MENVRHPKLLLDYRLIGRRDGPSSLKRQVDGYSCEAETGHVLAEGQKKKKTTVATYCTVLYSEHCFTVWFAVSDKADLLKLSVAEGAPC
jgi:hypothetical protein